MKKFVNKLFVGILIIQLVVLNSIPVYAQEVTPTPTDTSLITVGPAEEVTVSELSEPPEGSIPPSTEIPPNPDTSGPQAQTSSVSDPLSNWNNLSDAEKDAYRAEQKEKAETQYLASQGLVRSPDGDITIATGDAQNNASLTNFANTNLSSSPLSSGAGGSASVVNSGNGSSSNNNGSATIINNDTTDQNNSAHVVSGLDQSATTGNNNGSYNVGDTTLATGDANTTGTLINAVNTNVDGVMVSEFNIVDDHVGDIVLDFNANCISGCGLLGLSSQNSGNGADSTNTATTDVINNTNTFQNNTGTVGNEMVLSADSGNNSSSYNTGGDSAITTGDANIAGNALTFLNNNIAGNVIFSVVNIFGNLIGDIIFPESQLSCCGGSISAANTGNGADSTNTATASLTNNTNTFQTNDATINNNLVFGATTGDNSAGFNTGGNSAINTGQANVDANVLNIANTNIVGGNMWLVLINYAGNWVGKLIGAPEGQSYLGSEGLEFTITPTGEISVSNGGNGANSTNTATASTTNNTTTTQNNTGTVNNALRFNANTGGNDANFNTGGNSTITTGDANIIANLVNFVNNNIVGGGKLFVTIVNVFGSWTGDFVGPNSAKAPLGKPGIDSSSTGNNNGGGLLNSLGGNSNSNPSRPSNSSNTSGSPTDTRTGSVTLSSSFNNTGNASGATTGTGTNTSTNPQSGLLASTKVLAMNTKDAAASKDKKIQINLAWVMLLLPLFVLGLVVRKIVSNLLKRV